MNAVNETIGRQIAWNRLIAVVEEQAQTLIRIAFSTTVREAGDLSAGVFDPQGRMLAQAVTGTPGHVNAMAAAVGHVLAVFPIEEMAPGDVFVTNDPWKGTGHLNDFTVVTPVHRNGKPIALVASTSHMVDVGGLGFGTDGQDVHEEGLYVPIVRFVRAGQMDMTLMQVILANVRFPMEVEGDLRALITCNGVCARRIVDLVGELGMTDLDALGEFILTSSERAMRQAINELPKGQYDYAMTIDGVEEPIELKARLTIGDGEMLIDFAGTSAAVKRGINVPMIYNRGHGQLRRALRGRRTHSEQRRLAGAGQGGRAGRLDPERGLSRAGIGPPCGRPDGAGCGPRLPQPSRARSYAGRRRVVPVDPGDVRRDGRSRGSGARL